MFAGTTIAITILSVLLAGLASYVLGKWLFTKDSEVEARRRAAMLITGKLEAFGLKRLPKITGAYAIGDYSLLAHEIKSFAEMLVGDETVVLKEFDAVFNRVLDAKLATADGRTLLSAKIDDAYAIPTVAA